MASALIKAAVDSVLAGWTATDIARPNESYTPTGAPFVAIEYPGAAVDRADIGAPEAPMWDEAGAVMVHVFVPLGSGEAAATLLADAVWALFAGEEVDGVRFDSRLAGQSGDRAFSDGGPHWGVSFGIGFRLLAVSS